MRMLQYLKINRLWIVSSVCSLIVINTILFNSVSINKSIDDILYMNVLVFFIEIIFIIWGYCIYVKREKNICNKFNIENNKEIYSGDYFNNILEIVREIEVNKYLTQQEKYISNLNDLEEYITTWVHDIKVDIGVCCLLIEEESNDERIYTEIEKIKFKVNQILSITRANNYELDISVENVSVCKEIRNAIKDNSLFFINKNIEIETDLKDFQIISDKKWVNYIFSQIINNSSKYTKENGKIRIWSVEDNNANYIHIKDNGIGIPMEDIKRIFNKGFTGKNGRKGTKSTGMGLYYAKKIADRLNIDIIANSEYGLYTEFIVIFYKL